MIREAEEMLGVNLETLRSWDRDGTFEAVRLVNSDTGCMMKQRS